MVRDNAYARCLDIARRHYENFPVASRLMPAASRPHIAAVYAFARIADDFADEGVRSVEARLTLLDDWRMRLQEAVAGRVNNDGSDAEAIFVAVADTIGRFGLPVSLFEDLISAFSQDVTRKEYESWEDVLDYCRRSANPIGRLVLGISGYRDATLDTHSDCVCTALQLTNFWQDLEIDLRKGRLYVPLSDVRAAGADIADLRRRQMSPPWQQTLTRAADRTRLLFEQGRPVADLVAGRLKWELRATWLGGVRILERLVASRFDVFSTRPTLGMSDALLIGARMLLWRARPARLERTPVSG